MKEEFLRIGMKEGVAMEEITRKLTALDDLSIFSLL